MDPYDPTTWPTITTTDGLTPYLEGDFGVNIICLNAAEDATMGGERIDWDTLLDDISRDIEENCCIDLGSSVETPAFRFIEKLTRKHVREFREAE